MKKSTGKTDVKTYFVDTNVLLAASDVSRESHKHCHALLESGLAGKCSLFANGQIYREYLVVATRPVEVNGLGMATDEALGNLNEFSRCIRILEENVLVCRQVQSLTRQYNLKGKRIHDANIIATMMEHGLEEVVTENQPDFREFTGITVIDSKTSIKGSHPG